MRNLICFMLFLGLTITLCLRTFISMSIVLMVRPTFSNTTSAMDDKLVDDGLLDWPQTWIPLVFSVPLVGTVISLLFYFRFVADKRSPTRVVLVAVIIQSILSLISPIVARSTFVGFIAIRFALGLVEGCTISSFTTIVANWFPLNERSLKFALYTCGFQISFGVAQYLVSFIASLGLSWQWSFYIFGAIGLFFAIAWHIIVTDTPASNKFIGEEERLFLHKAMPHSTKHHNKVVKVPWRSILSSKVVAAHLACMASTYFTIGITTCFLPIYFRDELQLPIAYNGLFTATPFVAQIVSKLIIAAIIDWCKKHHGLSHTTAAKICQAIMGCGSASMLFAFPFSRSHVLTFIILIVWGSTSTLFVIGAYNTMTMIAPRFTGSIAGLHALVGAIFQLASTLLFSAFTWMEVSSKFHFSFGIAACGVATTAAVYIAWGTAEVQPWATDDQIVLKDKRKESKGEPLLGP